MTGPTPSSFSTSQGRVRFGVRQLAAAFAGTSLVVPGQAGKPDLHVRQPFQADPPQHTDKGKALIALSVRLEN